MPGDGGVGPRERRSTGAPVAGAVSALCRSTPGGPLACLLTRHLQYLLHTVTESAGCGLSVVPGVTIEAARRLAARIVDSYPRIPRVFVHGNRGPGPAG